jgi:hypothetical protein
MQFDWLFWGIAFLLFLPLHLGTPLLFLLIQDGPEGVRTVLPRLLRRGAISAAMAFALAIWLWPASRPAAISAIVIAMFHPWWDLLLARCKR